MTLQNLLTNTIIKKKLFYQINFLLDCFLLYEIFTTDLFYKLFLIIHGLTVIFFNALVEAYVIRIFFTEFFILHY